MCILQNVPSGDLAGIFLVVRLGLWVLGRKTPERRHHFYHIISKAHTINMTPPRWPWSSGWGHTYQASPLRVLFCLSPFLNCALWKAVAVARTPLRNGELCSKPFRVENIQTSFGILQDGRFGKFLINIYLSHTPTPRYVLKRNENSGSHKNLYTNVYSNSIHNCPKLKIPQMSSPGAWLNKLWGTYESRPLSNKTPPHATAWWTSNAWCWAENTVLGISPTPWLHL